MRGGVPRRPGQPVRLRPDVQTDAPGLPDTFNDLDRLRRLQLVRKVMADVEVAVARRLLLRLEQELQAGQRQLTSQTEDVRQRRGQALLERQANAAHVSTLSRWRQMENQWMEGLQAQRGRVRTQEEGVELAAQSLERSQLRRRKIESRRFKFEEMLDALAQG